MKFYLGTHISRWLGQVDVPLFVSRRRLVEVKTLPVARTSWALDSGGFSELSMFGQWTTPPEQYAAEVRYWAIGIGQMDWASVQDWMCEPSMLAKTGLSVYEHQRRTVENTLNLLSLAPELPWAPVLQGWELSDYRAHIDMYRASGVDLWKFPTVGVGTMCRRQHTDEAAMILRALASEGLSIHGFGLKMQGLSKVADVLTSADSMAWSYNARKEPPLPGCTGHKNCANCQRYALQWYRRVIERVGVALVTPQQLFLPYA